MAGNKWWTSGEKQVLSQHFKYISNQRLTQLLEGRSERSIRNQASRMGLQKAAERIAEVGRERVALRADRQPLKAPPEIQA